MRKIVTVVGARPQFIKAAAVSRAARRLPDLTELLVHTGQHYDPNMSDVFFSDLQIPAPAYHLGIGSGAHGAQTGKMLEAIEDVLVREKPDWVLVYGDTNSTLAGALAAVKLHLPVAHVEAGLRSFNRRMPEEINRVMTDHAADLLFTPTETATAHLKREGVAAGKIRQVGDVMYDAALFFGERAETESGILRTLALEPRRYVLGTIHRAENTDVPERLTAIVEGLCQVAREIPVVLPLHPRTRHILERAGTLKAMTERLRVLEPLGYLDMVMLEKNARLIATDSGGVQKEAFFYRVPCVTLRDETEWTELVELGWNHLLTPASDAAVAAGVLARLNAVGREGQPYGNGAAAEAILAGLLA